MLTLSVLFYSINKHERKTNSEENFVMELIETKILFFAKARELLGKDQGRIKVPKNSQNGEKIFAIVEETFPALKTLNRGFILALNEEYLDSDASVTIKIGDEFAVIPPISGG